jgi:hypothetical protein
MAFSHTKKVETELFIKVRIRIRSLTSGSGSDHKGPDPTGSGSTTLVRSSHGHSFHTSIDSRDTECSGRAGGQKGSIRPWQDSNLQSPDPKSGALSIRPQGQFLIGSGLNCLLLLMIKRIDNSGAVHIIDRACLACFRPQCYRNNSELTVDGVYKVDFEIRISLR